MVSGPKASIREWIGLAVIALPCLLYSMDLTVLHLAVPRLSVDLKPSSVQLLWIIDIYGFLVAGSLITAGTLGDRIGRRRLLLIGAAMFGTASVLAAFSRSATMLIATRALLGVAGATIAPSTLSLIRNMFRDDRERTRAISIWIISFSLGGEIGPIVGGAMIERFWWGSVFLLSVPVMVLLLVLGPLLLPEYRDPNPGKPDPLSAALSLTAVLAIVFGLKRIAQDGVDVAAIAYLRFGRRSCSTRALFSFNSASFSSFLSISNWCSASHRSRPGCGRCPGASGSWLAPWRHQLSPVASGRRGSCRAALLSPLLAICSWRF
jgi:DHA2 family multidrug resistance protein-like MFS transporter